MTEQASTHSANTLRDVPAIDALNDSEVRTLAQSLIQRIAQQAGELHLRQTKIDALTHEIALLRHHRFAAKTEAMDALQAKLFEEAAAEDLSAATTKLQALQPVGKTKAGKTQPRRTPLPEYLDRVEIHHEPASTECDCGQAMQRIGEDASERLDFVPGTLRVERHIRGVWVCRCCECVRQQSAPARIVAGGIPTEALLAHVVMSKYDDHLPLYRQSEMFARQGVQISASTMADWVGAVGVALSPIVAALKAEMLQGAVLHADESPITILQAKGGKERGYIWAYASGKQEATGAVVYQVQPGRNGKYAREFLQHAPEPTAPGEPPKMRAWQGHLVVDDYGGYKALFLPPAQAQDQAPTNAVVEVGCWAHVRRKFVELHVAAKSTLAQTVLEHIGALYHLEARSYGLQGEEVTLQALTAQRQLQAKPRLEALHAWLCAQREQLHPGVAIIKAIDYTLKRWPALIRYADDARLPMDNNRVENLIRPWAVGRKNWLFAGSLAAAQRAADIMSLIESAKLNGIEPGAYLCDVLTKLPTHPNSRIVELLPTHWKPTPVAQL